LSLEYLQSNNSNHTEPNLIFLFFCVFKCGLSMTLALPYYKIVKDTGHLEYTAKNNSGRFLNTLQDLDAPEKLKEISVNPLS
jgi:hypothetical protein